MLLLGHHMPATALTFTFEFAADGTVLDSNVTGTVAGRIVGISEGDSTADAVFIDVFPAAFAPTLTPGIDLLSISAFPQQNDFTVFGTTITDATFIFSSSGIELCLDAIGFSGGNFCNNNDNLLRLEAPLFNAGNNAGFAGVSFALAPVPVPAAAPLLAGGIALLAMFRRRRTII